MDKIARSNLLGLETKEDRVYKLAAFNLRKQAGLASEIVGTALWAPIPSLAGGAAGAAKGGVLTKKEMKEFNNRSWSNLIPGVGAWRLGRRLQTRDNIKRLGK